VDDVVQESLLRVWHARAKQPIASAKAFLFKVARHMAIDVTRRNKISPIEPVRDLDALLVIGDEPTAVDAASMQEKTRMLAQAIDALPGRCRAVVILRKLQSVSQREVAAQLGISEKTVEAQLSRGLKRCEAYLRRRGVHHYYTHE
jgi:RNA polymerase sigma-70 factor (ECF subfamily)